WQGQQAPHNRSPLRRSQERPGGRGPRFWPSREPTSGEKLPEPVTRRLRTPEVVLHVTTLARKSRASHTADRGVSGQDPFMRHRVLITDDNTAFRAAARRP